MVWEEGSSVLSPEIHSTLAHLIEVHAEAGAIAIDIPIGLSATGERQCDFEARQMLGSGRASSVFPPPVPGVLGARSHAEAVLISQRLIGKGVSQQSFAIFDKIKEANETVIPAIQDRVFEMHPEVSFHVLAGQPLLHRKSTSEGYYERRALLEWVMGVQLPNRHEAHQWARPAKPDDLLDATVAAWAASAVIRGEEGRLPKVPEFADSGLRMEMVFGSKPPGHSEAMGFESGLEGSPYRSNYEPTQQDVNAMLRRHDTKPGSVSVTLSGATAGICMCGCGKSTAKRFYPGHDGRLYSWLERAERDGDQEAANLLQFLKGNHDRSTFDEQRTRVGDWLGQQGNPTR